MLIKYVKLAIIFGFGAAGNFMVQVSPSITLTKFFNKYPQIWPDVVNTYSIGKFQGFSGSLSIETIKSLYKSPLVTAISPDVEVKADDIQYHAPRHLARISQRERLQDDLIYVYDDIEELENIDIYIIDTGIFSKHEEFEGRASQGIDLTGEGVGDFNGHGTHVAGIAGSKTFGVAKTANLIEVKVLSGNGSGNLSTVIAGIDYAVNHSQRSGRKAVANLSLGAGYNGMLNSAVDAAVDSGLPMIVAAGNSNTAACGTSPAGSKRAITVGAIDDRYDSVASFSNWGSCVNVFASGVYVTSLAHQGNGTLALSGTSMASPIVAGIVAMFLASGDDAQGAMNRLIRSSTKGNIPRTSTVFRPRTPNRIAYSDPENPEESVEDEFSPVEGTRYEVVSTINSSVEAQ